MALQKSLKKKKSDATNDKAKSLGTFSNYDEKITVWKIIGLLVCILCGGGYTYVVCQIHEARMFFTGIMVLSIVIN